MSRQMLQGETFFLLTADQIFYESINLPFNGNTLTLGVIFVLSVIMN